MILNQRARRLRRTVLVGVCISTALTAAACSSSAKKSPSGNTGGSSSAATLDNARQELALAYKGFYTKPPTAPSPGAKTKSILIMSAGQAAETDSAAVVKLQAAAALLGWKSTVCDGKLDPSVFPTCVSQAIAQHVDGIVSEGIDCALVKPQLEQAEQAGIKVVGMFAWDCNEINPSEPKLITKISYGSRFANEADAYKALGEGAAAWTVVQTTGKANVLNLTNQEYNTLKFMQDGYSTGMKSLCPDCTLNNVDWLAKNLGPNLQATVQASLLKYPSTNVVYGNTDPELGPSAAVLQAAKTSSVKVLGGLGLGINFDSVRNNKGLNAVMAYPGGWYAYATIDTLNSLFSGTSPRDEGFGTVMVDATHGLPAAGISGYYDVPGIDYVAAYKASWGV
jgi:ribose transport system substrate-binding protein